MKIFTKLAKSISYGGTRGYDEIKYIVIHYTGNKKDTAQNNAVFFANSNIRYAGAHYFVDKKGVVYKSVNLNRSAYAVGGKYSLSNGAGRYYGKCTNANSVSIELCDCCTNANWEQMKAVKILINEIRKKCPNAKTIIRHWDVNGKECPAPMAGKYNKKWEHLHNYLTKGYQYEAKVIKNAAIRSSGKVAKNNKIGSVNVGKIVKITKTVGKWGRLKEKDKHGRYQWIVLSKLKEI